jgi:hypothetical protein
VAKLFERLVIFGNACLGKRLGLTEIFYCCKSYEKNNKKHAEITLLI